jgi:putative endonuclease
MPWTVYLARCRDGSLYTGITTDLKRRLAEHNSGCGGSYTRCRIPIVMVYWESAKDRSGALRREGAIKGLSHAGKEKLVVRASTG